MDSLFEDFTVDLKGKAGLGFYQRPSIGTRSLEDTFGSNPEFDSNKKLIANMRTIIETILDNEVYMAKVAGPELDLIVVVDVIKEINIVRSLGINNPTLYSSLMNTSHNPPGIYLENHWGQRSVLEIISEYANSSLNLKYLVQQIERGKRLLKDNFSEIFCVLEYEVSLLTGAGSNEATHSRSKDNKELITFYSKEKFPHHPQVAELEDIFEKGTKFKRKIVDLLWAIHEYGHGIYNSINPEPPSVKGLSQEEYYTTADSVYNEGLAMLLEIETAKKLLTSKTFEITGEDKQELHRYIQVRIKNLKPSYREGFELFSSVYKKGGIQEVKEQISKIDRCLAFDVRRGSIQYTKMFR